MKAEKKVAQMALMKVVSKGLQWVPHMAASTVGMKVVLKAL